MLQHCKQVALALNCEQVSFLLWRARAGVAPVPVRVQADMMNLVALTALGVFTSVPALASSLNACNPGIEYFELEGFVTAATVSDGPLFEAPTDTFPIPSEVCSCTCCK